MGKTISKGKAKSAVNADGRVTTLEITTFAGKGARVKTLPLMQLNKLGSRTHSYAGDYKGPFTDKDGVTHENAIKNTQSMLVGETPMGLLRMEATLVKNEAGEVLAYFCEPIIYAPESK